MAGILTSGGVCDLIREYAQILPFFVIQIVIFFFQKKDICTGVAWLLSVRVVKFLINFFNERNFYF